MSPLHQGGIPDWQTPDLSLQIIVLVAEAPANLDHGISQLNVDVTTRVPRVTYLPLERGDRRFERHEVNLENNFLDLGAAGRQENDAGFTRYFASPGPAQVKSRETGSVSRRASNYESSESVALGGSREWNQ